MYTQAYTQLAPNGLFTSVDRISIDAHTVHSSAVRLGREAGGEGDAGVRCLDLQTPLATQCLAAGAWPMARLSVPPAAGCHSADHT